MRSPMNSGITARYQNFIAIWVT